MRRATATATPCPVSTYQLSNINDTYTEDSTANIDFTTAFDASFKNVKPRRGQLARRRTTTFAIHEDGTEVAKQHPSTLSQPAKRVIAQSKPGDDRLSNNNHAPCSKPFTQVQNAKRAGPLLAPKRVPARVSIEPEPIPDEETIPPEPSKGDEKRPARRKTIYIPSDDTTQPTMWMGIFSPIKNVVLNSHNEAETAGIELTGIAAQMLEKRRRKSSAIQPKVKRAPLRPSLTAQAHATASADQVGEPTGKENVPPGYDKGHVTKKIKHLPGWGTKKLLHEDRDVQRKKFLTQARLENLARPKDRSPQSSTATETMYEVGRSELDHKQPKNKRIAWNAGSRVVHEVQFARKEPEPPALCVQPKSPEAAPRPRVPTRFVQPILKDAPLILPQVPVIEHIENPEMYEEDWLTHQEIVITQLLNSVFDQADSRKSKELDYSTVRAQLVDRYNSPEVRLVYSRVQAAALYGSLSLSHEAMFNVQNLVKDVGRKKAYLKFWLDTYDSEMLQVALETISGKQIRKRVQRNSSSSSPYRSTNRQCIAQFIEDYMLRHEDGQFKPAGSGNVSDLGSKTLIKSIMLVKALDLLKQGRDPMVEKCLFRRNANIKSSSSAAQHIVSMLNPAVGDNIRVLRQLGYEVFHQQSPLDEVSYKVDNLAVDLRDGVNFTRLVEILLYRSAGGTRSTCHQDTGTICIFEGETVTIDHGESNPLTQHLKLPCINRALKLWNVQIGLGALWNIRHIRTLIGNIQAEDIVDGFREKTIKLLWTIIGRFGLAGILDQNDMKQEIRRLDPTGTYDIDGFNDHMDTDFAQETCENLLKDWTRAVASSKGLTVHNFTTSFSDGQVFRAIVDEYEPYLIEQDIGNHQPLHLRLSRLGCSRQFSDLFFNSSGQIHIFGKDFVLAALAFLCSRVVSPSKLCRSAVKLQRCWRKYWQGVLRKRQAMKKRIAEACAARVFVKEEASGLTSSETATPENESDIWLSL